MGKESQAILTQVYKSKPTLKPYDALLAEKINKRTYAIQSHKNQLTLKTARQKPSKFCKKKLCAPAKTQTNR